MKSKFLKKSIAVSLALLSLSSNAFGMKKFSTQQPWRPKKSEVPPAALRRNKIPPRAPLGKLLMKKEVNQSTEDDRLSKKWHEKFGKIHEIEILGVRLESEECEDLVDTVANSSKDAIRSLGMISRENLLKLNEYAYRCATSDMNNIKNYLEDFNFARKKILEIYEVKKDSLLLNCNSNKEFIKEVLQYLWLAYTKHCVDKLERAVCENFLNLSNFSLVDARTKCMEELYEGVNDVINLNKQDALVKDFEILRI